jgi:carbonic anhydrase
MENRMNPQESLQMLMEGNARFREGKPRHPNQSETRRREVLGGQHPFAVVLSCSDSRVPPEILFDCGIGDLFVVRTAGNVVDEVALGSIEYAVEHLHTTLVLVMGHQNCGAVNAAIQGGDPGGHIASITGRIAPAVEAAKSMPGDWAVNTVNANVGNVVGQLKTSRPKLEEFCKTDRVVITGARYDLVSGVVTFFQ